MEATMETSIDNHSLTDEIAISTVVDVDQNNIAFPYYSNTNGRLVGQTDLRLQFRNVNYELKERNSKLVKILNELCGEFVSGRLTAVLGPSGAGKTSMLNVLSGFKAKGVTGQFELNGKERNLLTFRKLCSYIPQEFAMLDLLTVEETLKVSADLKLSTDKSAKEKQEIIDDVLQILNMVKCRDNLVGTLSGGERKRLSIGVELITNPPIMFFDEPTSGLDSVASLQIINYLRRLAYDGRIIICIVHQPSSRLMKLFDDVFVLSHGEILYGGPQNDMLAHFEESGFICPKYFNPADFVLEIGSVEHNTNISALIERNKHKYSIKHKGSAESLKHDENSEMLPTSTMNTRIAIQDSNKTNSLPELQIKYFELHKIVRPKEQVSVCRQIVVLTRRSLRSMSRNMISVQLRVIMHFVVAILLGVVFWNIGNDAAKAITNSSSIFFVVLFLFFGNALPSIILCQQETAVFLREYLNGWYSVEAYYISKLIADLPLQLCCPSIFILIIYYMTGQPLEMDRFLMCFVVSLMINIIGHFYGLVFGCLFDLQVSIFLVPSTAIPLLLFSGFFIRIHELATFLRPLCDFSAFRYTLEGLMLAIYGFDRPELDCHIDFCYFKSPKKFLKEMSMLDANYSYDLLALFLWILFFKILFYLSLLLRIRRTQ
ncbi:ATP-binding cassette sub-family G member 4 [Teleopsis dalmanni]|uniref:ATP-binding cassette sub-family G member 4 n=1 Tax=Teleopsis dalmanni TaxID=139649 RepID=UPI0018CE000F|nr:ATP-binding cassette sub-family G member 4 [Teleopsis dalmanni]